MTDAPEAKRNRTGCFAIAAILALFIALYMTVGFSGEASNEATEQIQTVPAR